MVSKSLQTIGKHYGMVRKDKIYELLNEKTSISAPEIPPEVSNNVQTGTETPISGTEIPQSKVKKKKDV